ncbi:hypothetical protein B0H14DRAFT_2738003 [Mycena olivaceomarginata]|nr:hypothetical protein B0H14DRAFT_2738003 [Mycena olivaceomarginata]
MQKTSKRINSYTMTFTPFSDRVRAAIVEQTERTGRSSKADIKRLIEESELKIISLDELLNRERAYVAALKYLISPIRTLPVELLAAIFVLAVHETYDHTKDAFRISHVCSHWMQVARNTPGMWNRRLRVCLPGFSASRDEEYAYGLKDWLARSAPLPVPITWCLDDSCLSSEEVLRIAPRWRSLDFEDDTPRWMISRLAECNLESLEELSLDIPLDPGALAFTVPRLRKLSFSIESDTLPILPIPWAQLVDLTFSCYALNSQPDIAFALLAQCPNLVRASVFTGLLLPGARRDTLVLSHLRSLHLHFLPTHDGVLFLDCISVPALEELSSNLGNTIGLWMQTGLAALLRAPNITTLELEHSDLTSDDLRAVLHHAPSLHSLKLTRCPQCFDDALIDSLYCRDGVEPLVPHLHSLVLEDIPVVPNYTEDHLAGMIASRWWTDAELASHRVPPAVARWKLVRLHGESREFSPHFVDILEGLQRKGIPLDLVQYEQGSLSDDDIEEGEDLDQ